MSYNQIDKNIYLGGILPTQDPEFLKKIDIIIDMVDYHGLHTPKYPPRILYYHFPIDDLSNQNIRQYFDKTYKLIDYAVTNNKNIYIHCMAGISRSSTILIAYYMKKYCIPLNQAMKMVSDRRNIIQPNPGFIEQLKDYEKYVINILC